MKKWSHLSGFHISFLCYGPQIVKNVVFFAYVADVSKKCKAVIAIYVNGSESSCFALLENGSGSYVLT